MAGRVTAARRGGWPGPRKIEVNVTMPPDQLARVEAYARRCGVKRSEAIRRCVAAGLHRLEAETAAHGVDAGRSPG
jgi:metal-responsive CopG/Arc/MetJ family transcriptional regulator